MVLNDRFVVACLFAASNLHRPVYNCRVQGPGTSQGIHRQFSIVRPHIERSYQAPGNQKNLKVNTIYGIGSILVFWFQRIIKEVLSFLSMVASWYQDREVSEYDQEIQQSLTPDQLTTSCGKATEHLQ